MDIMDNANSIAKYQSCMGTRHKSWGTNTNHFPTFESFGVGTKCSIIVRSGIKILRTSQDFFTLNNHHFGVYCGFTRASDG